MNSPFVNLFYALQAQIQSLVPAIRWIDQEMGQLEHYTERPPVSWPCVLIDFDGWSFENMGRNCQTAEGDIILRLGFAPFSYSNQLSPVKDAALAFYDVEFSLHQALHDWQPGGFSHLTRLTANTEKRHDAIRVRMLRYHTAFEDYSTQPVTTPASPNAVFNI
ncbi:MAG: hypothetical protein EPN37_04440 [Chitinophagaceae bacterium]|nr:MAG: hypothetical protein EPN37_04440 [Chitinophagaceae bacterium]